jgi:DNA recombination protein RmuC
LAPTLLFITGVLAGLIAGYILSGLFFRRRGGDGYGERKLLEERLLKADQGLEQFTQELQSQRQEAKVLQSELVEARESAVGSRTQVLNLQQERDEIRSQLSEASQQLERFRSDRENLGRELAEAKEQFRSQQEHSESLDKSRSELKYQLIESLDQLERTRSEREQFARDLAETREQLRSQQEQTKFFETARADLLSQFRALSGQMLDGSRNALMKTNQETVAEPVGRQVEQLRKQVEALQKESTEKLGVLAQTTIDLRQRSEDVQGAAQQLTSALRSPNVKGQWGEMNLRRILEFVGLISYCDFDQQVHVGTDDGAYRPDCVITIPGSRRLIVDSKAPIESYLDALNATDEAAREAALKEHLRKVRSHVDLLSKKDYAGRLGALGQVVDGVLLFIPVEGALSMALERDPQLLEYAFSKNIILTFPTSLLAILKGLAMTIQQAEIAKNIEEIRSNAVELHKRFLTFVDKLNAVGTSLSKLNRSFNDAVGSAQSRLLPQGRRFAELAGQNSEPKMPEAVENSVRELTTGEG